MPPRRRATAPTPIDIEAVRRKLDEGKIVRVGISKSAQFPDGGTGRVRRVGDPSVDGDEYVQVELSLNGTRDVLPFTPGDLTPATRATAAAPPPEPKKAKPASPRAPRGTPGSSAGANRPRAVPEVGPTTGGAPASPVAPTTSAVVGQGFAGQGFSGQGLSGHGLSGQPKSGQGLSGHAPPRPDSPAPGGPAPTGESGTDDPSATPTARPRVAERPSVGAAAGPGKVARSGRVNRSGKKSPAVTITIATTDSEPPQWRIEARVGARVVLRSGSVAPARVWELVRQLDQETLTSTVGGILDEQRRSAQARADALAAELAQVRAELEALPEGGP